jgi:fatty acid desaturase
MVSYSCTAFGLCVGIPLSMIKTGSLYGLAEWTDRKRPLRAIGMWTHLILYLGIVIVCPFFTSSSVVKAAASVLLHVATSGLIFGIFTQINHLNEASVEINPRNRKNLAVQSWAASQVESSNNFAANSGMWHILSNGLNLQIEHHLFPSLNHSHLQLIAPVVKQTCEEYGVTYKSYGTFSELMGAALNWLDTLSDAPDLPQEKGLSTRSRAFFYNKKVINQ